MKYLTYVLSFVITLSWYSCEKCEIENRIEFMPISRTFLPDIEGDTIVFVDSLGNEMKFVGEPLRILENSANINIECSDGKIEEHSAISENNVLKARSIDGNEAIYYQLVHGIKNTLNGLGVTEITDLLIVTVSAASKENSFTIVTSARIDNPTGFLNYTEQIPDMTLLGKIFYDVHKSIRVNSSVLYNKEFGIVSFRDEAYKLWIHDRIE